MFKSLLSILAIASVIGCNTPGVRSDSFPPDLQCLEARQQAIRNYTAHYGTPRIIPPVSVTVTTSPPSGYGAITTGARDGYRIQIWKDQRPFFGSLVHEFEHTLKQSNGHGQQEGW